YVGGGAINWYKNLRVEENLPCDTFKVKLEDACWGKFHQLFNRALVLHQYCLTQPMAPPKHTDPKYLAFIENSKTLHTGNTLCFLDFDGDGDKDMLNGNISFNDILYAQNGKVDYGYAQDTMVTQDSIWSDMNGKEMKTDFWPAAFELDLEQDGKKDIAFTPHVDFAAENYKSIHFYKKQNTAQYYYVSDTFLVDQMIDVGAGSHPLLYDYNKDGKPDLFVASEGRYVGNGLSKGRVSYYQNTTTFGNPSFKENALDFLNLSTQNYGGFSIAIGDLNNDGKDDLVIGKQDGTLVFYRNNATSNTVQPNWVFQYNIMKDDQNVDIHVGQRARPFIADVNNDGKPDLLIGRMNGYVAYYENQGCAAGNVVLKKVSDSLGQMRNNNTYYPSMSTVYFGPTDNTGKKYFVLGGNEGMLSRYELPANLNQPFNRI